MTRLDASKFEALPAEQRAQLDYCDLSRTAILGSLEPPRASAAIAVLAAGTSDLTVSREAVRTLHYYGQSCTEWNDIGVAGIWRLLERLGRHQDSRNRDRRSGDGRGFGERYGAACAALRIIHAFAEPRAGANSR